MGRFANWLFGNNNTNEAKDIRSVEEMRQSMLASVVANRQAMTQAIEGTLDSVLPKIDSLIYRNFSSGQLYIEIKLELHSDKTLKYTCIDAGYRLPGFYMSIGNGFTAGNKHHAFGNDNNPYEYVDKLCNALKKSLEEKGFLITRAKQNQEKDRFEFRISWKDEIFDKAMSEFDDESQVHAFYAGVPLADILA